MNSEVIFETNRLAIRKLQMKDIEPYHEMQSNPNVMQYVAGKVQSKEDHWKELTHLLALYQKKDNDFWIYAVERKSDKAFVGTLALVKDSNGDDEIGYRFLEKYWGMGYGYDLCKGTIAYCKSIGMQKLMGYVFDINLASGKILENCNFQIVNRRLDPETKLPETHYQLML